jgi:hypothetical protein
MLCRAAIFAFKIAVSNRMLVLLIALITYSFNEKGRSPGLDIHPFQVQRFWAFPIEGFGMYVV